VREVIEAQESLNAITFVVRFQTSQFREHIQKLARKTYLIPLPSAVAGLLCAILGVRESVKEWESLKEFCEKKGILSGAELVKLGGYALEYTRIFKFDRDASGLSHLLRKLFILPELDPRERENVIKAVQELTPIKKSEVLFDSTYKFAISLNDENMLRECVRRINDLDLEFDIFGGNDYNFVHYIGDVRYGSLIKSRDGRGYCPITAFEEVRAATGSFNVLFDAEELGSTAIVQPTVIPAYVGADIRERFVFSYGADLIVREPLDVINDGVSKIFVYPAAKFVVKWGGRARER